MNKLESSSIGRTTFKTIIRDMFDDCFDIDETYIDHSECSVQLGAHIDLDMATELVDYYGLNIPPSDLVGTWMIEATRDRNNGLYWDEVCEAVKVEEVTETKTVTKWKPICNEDDPICSIKQPQSKVCLPK